MVNGIGNVNLAVVINLIDTEYSMDPVNINNKNDLAICKAALDLFESIKVDDLDFGATPRKYGINTNSAKVSHEK